jgi:phosphoserine phosphatase RsbU/P
MPGPNKKLILIVDDSPTIVAAISGALRGFFRTKIAKSGEKALAIVNGAEKPHLILLDVMLPDIDGFEVCRRLKEKPETSNIPVIFLTGKTDPSDEVKGFEVGGNDYIRKPFPAEVVLARVKTQLALKAALEDAKSASLEHSFMSSEALSSVLTSLTPIQLQPEETLLQKGEESDAAYYLESGYLHVYEDTRYGPVTLAKLKSPRLIGEIGALAGIPRTASVEALTEARVYRISRAQLFKLSRKSPELLMAVVGQLGQQINSVGAAVALYTNALAALEKHEFDKQILDELANPPPQLGEFASAFRRFADQILTKQRQQEEMASAALIQQSFLPEKPALEVANKGVEIESKIRPARAVGGDFYDFFMLDEDRLAVVIGDVCGKGIPASLFMAVVVTVLRAAAREAENAAATIERANSTLCRNNAASLFATVFYAVLNMTDGTLEYCNCGHTAPVLISVSGDSRALGHGNSPRTFRRFACRSGYHTA